MVQVAVLGYGTVGGGVVQVLEENREKISIRALEDIHVKYILDLKEFPGDPYEDRVVHDFEQILNGGDRTGLYLLQEGTGSREKRLYLQ